MILGQTVPQDMFTNADSPNYCLSNLPGSDDNNYAFHGRLSSCSF